MKIKIVPKDKRLLKSSRVRAWLRECEKVIEQRLIKDKARDKIIEALFLGCPLLLKKDGSLKVVRNYHI